MLDIEIQTYWNVETLYYVFNAVAAFMHGATFSGLLKLVFLFAIALGMFAYAGNKQLEMAKWFVQALIFVTLLNLPIARVALTDKTGLEPPRSVDNVPFALAIIGQTTNLVFGSLTAGYETVFGVPEDVGLAKGDIGFGHRILKQVNRAEVRDPQLRSDLMQFFKECTLYDVKDGEITVPELVSGTDTWTAVFTKTSPARFTTYNTLTSTPTTDTCRNVAVILKNQVDAAVTAAQTFYGKQAFTRASSDALATSMFVSVIGTSNDWILSSSATASDSLKQAMFNNMWRDAGTELPAIMGDPARIAELQSLAGQAQAARQADGSNSTLSLMAQETLPHMRNWLEAILYAMFPVVVVVMVVVSAEGAKKVIAGYMMSLCWIGLWPVLFAVINHLSMMHMRYKANALALAAGVPFQLSDAFDATLSSEQAMIGYMVVLVPFIAGAIIKMGQGGFMSVADKMITGFQSAGSAVGSSLATGNVSMGQVGVDTASVNSTSMHKYDSNIDLSGGGANIGMGGGGRATIAANGSVALQQMRNSLLTSLGVDERFESQRSQEGHRTNITSSGSQLSQRHSDGASLTDVKGHDESRGAYQNSGVTAGYSRSGAETGSHSVGQGLSKGWRDGSSFNTSVGANDVFGANLGIGRGGGAAGPAPVGGGTGPAAGGGGGSGPHAPSAPNPADEKRMVDAMRKGNATQAEIDKAVKNFRGGATDISYRSVVDDFGNEHRIPIGQSKPGAPAKAPEAPSRGGGLLSAGLGASTSKTYAAAHSREKSTSDQHTADETARTERNFSISGQRSVQGSAGSQSAQGSRHATDAALTSVDDRSSVRDVSDRTEQGVGTRNSRSESASLSVHKDLLSDPDFLEKVARRNGMTAMRFANQSRESAMRMVMDYASEKGMFQKANTLSSTGMNGQNVPTSQADLDDESRQERSKLPNDISARHRRNVGKTGYGGVSPVQPDTSMPAIATATEGEVRSQLDPQAAGSIPSRAGALNENVQAWASPDKAPGQGRANPLAVVEDAIGRDVVDFGAKVVDKITGGDGTADGEKLTENMKREKGTSLQINTNTKKP